MNSPDTEATMPLPLGIRLLMMAGVASSATGPLESFMDRIPSAVIAAVLAVLGGLVLEYFRPVVRAKGEKRARRYSSPSDPPPSPPTTGA